MKDTTIHLNNIQQEILNTKQIINDMELIVPRSKESVPCIIRPLFY